MLPTTCFSLLFAIAICPPHHNESRFSNALVFRDLSDMTASPWCSAATCGCTHLAFSCALIALRPSPCFPSAVGQCPASSLCLPALLCHLIGIQMSSSTFSCRFRSACSNVVALHAPDFQSWCCSFARSANPSVPPDSCQGEQHASTRTLQLPHRCYGFTPSRSERSSLPTAVNAATLQPNLAFHIALCWHADCASTQPSRTGSRICHVTLLYSRYTTRLHPQHDGSTGTKLCISLPSASPIVSSATSSLLFVILASTS